MPMAIDGTVSADNNPGGNTTTVVLPGLTTTQANDYIMLGLTANNGPLVSVSGSSLGSLTQVASITTSGRYSEIWAKFSASTLASEVITVVTSMGTYLSATAFGVSGSGQTSLVWDAGTPASGSSMPFSYVSTTPDCMVIADWGDWQNNSLTSPSGGVMLNASYQWHSLAYYLRTSAGTTTFQTGTGDSNAMVGVGIPLAGGGGGGGIVSKRENFSDAVRRSAYW